jgi:hypothetical protein
VDFQPLPPPPLLFRQFQRGEITRPQLHAAMRMHALELIEEMEEIRRNPVAAFIEQLRNRSAAARLAKQHGMRNVRRVLSALSEISDFPPAVLLWNALHDDVPLHCFIRTRHEPVFRIVKLQIKPQIARIAIEYGRTARPATTAEVITLRRDRFGEWQPVLREKS